MASSGRGRSSEAKATGDDADVDEEAEPESDEDDDESIRDNVEVEEAARSTGGDVVIAGCDGDALGDASGDARRWRLASSASEQLLPIDSHSSRSLLFFVRNLGLSFRFPPFFWLPSLLTLLFVSLFWSTLRTEHSVVVVAVVDDATPRT